jgi:hypothetical protein
MSRIAHDDATAGTMRAESATWVAGASAVHEAGACHPLSGQLLL